MLPRSPTTAATLERISSDMRGLHTADWHVGKLNYGLKRNEDHEHVFEQMYALAKDEKVDIIIHSGDLYDKENPGTEVLKQGIAYLERLAEIAPVVFIPGNHDSNGMFEVIDALISCRRPPHHPIHILHTSRLKGERYGMLELASKDGRERLLVAGLPFIRPASFARQFIALGADVRGLEFADQIERLTSGIGAQFRAAYDSKTDVRIFVGHLLLQGSLVGGKDRGELALDIEEHTFGARGSSVPVVDYAALGHIHRPQTPPGCEYARYAGSPLAVDFGESSEEKGVQIFEARPGLPVRVRFVPLDVGRELVTATIPYEELPLHGPLLAGKLVKLTVLIDSSERNVYDYVKECMPDAVIARVIEQVLVQEGQATPEIPDTAALSPPDLFASYIANKRGFDKERANRYFRDLYGAATAGVQTRIQDIDALEQV